MVSQRIWRSLPPIFTRAKRLAFFCSVTFLPIYIVCRRYLIRAIVFSKYVQFTRFIKPHLVMMIKFNSIFTFTSNLRLLVLNLLMISCWEIAQAFWDVYLTQPLAISQFSDEPNRCLLDGLRASDPKIKVRPEGIGWIYLSGWEIDSALSFASIVLSSNLPKSHGVTLHEESQSSKTFELSRKS